MLMSRDNKKHSDETVEAVRVARILEFTNTYAAVTELLQKLRLVIRDYHLVCSLGCLVLSRPSKSETHDSRAKLFRDFAQQITSKTQEEHKLRGDIDLHIGILRAHKDGTYNVGVLKKYKDDGMDVDSINKKRRELETAIPISMHDEALTEYKSINKLKSKATPMLEYAIQTITEGMQELGFTYKICELPTGGYHIIENGATQPSLNSEDSSIPPAQEAKQSMPSDSSLSSKESAELSAGEVEMKVSHGSAAISSSSSSAMLQALDNISTKSSQAQSLVTPTALINATLSSANIATEGQLFSPEKLLARLNFYNPRTLGKPKKGGKVKKTEATKKEFPARSVG